MKSIIFIILILICMTNVVSGFEDTFQYYPLGTITTNDDWYIFTTNQFHMADIATSGATYSRVIRLVSDDYYIPGPTSGWVNLTNMNSFSTNYVGFNMRYGYADVGSSYYNEGWFKIHLLDSDFVPLMTDVIYDDGPNLEYLETGWWEYTISGTEISLRIDGVNQGIKSSGVTRSIAYITFELHTKFNSYNRHPYIRVDIDDFTTTGWVTGIGTESTQHTITESYLNPTNISFGINSYPAVNYQSAEYKIVIKRHVSDSFINIVNETVKPSGDTSPYTGFSNYNRSLDLTDNDTSYGMYFAYLTMDGVTKASDYFFLVPPGASSSVTFADSEIVVGQQEVINYDIGAFDSGTYDYHVRVYNYYGLQVFSETINTESGSVTWDTTDNDAGICYAVLSRTSSSGDYVEIAYVTGILTDNIIIKGYTYDLHTGEKIGNINVNFTQGSWFNTTSNETGYYELKDFVEDVSVMINASNGTYSCEAFEFTPLIPKIYTIDLYLTNNSMNYIDNTTIFGQIISSIEHQPIADATVNVWNGTGWDDTITSNSWGYYCFDNLGTNGTVSYYVNATKVNHVDSDNYTVNVTENNGSQQNIPLSEIYTLTIRAKDALSGAFIASFTVMRGDDVDTTTDGSVIYDNLIYSSIEASVSSEGYYAITREILVDSTKTEVFTLSKLVDDTEYYSPHYVKFVVTYPSGEPIPNIDINVYNGSEQSSLFTAISGTDGAVGFKLSQNVRYRMTFVNTALNINKTLYLYPIDTHYAIVLSELTVTPWNDIVYSLNTSLTGITLLWNDPNEELNNISMNITNSTATWIYSSTNHSGSFNFPVSNTTDKYYINVTMDMKTSGIQYIERAYTPSGIDVNLSNISEGFKKTVVLFIAMTMAMLFGFVHVRIGAILVAFTLMIMYYIGWLSSSIAVGMIVLCIFITLIRKLAELRRS